MPILKFIFFFFFQESMPDPGHPQAKGCHREDPQGGLRPRAQVGGKIDR